MPLVILLVVAAVEDMMQKVKNRQYRIQSTDDKIRKLKCS